MTLDAMMARMSVLPRCCLVLFAAMMMTLPAAAQSPEFSSYGEASEEARARATNLYGTGITLFKEGDFESARSLFQSALEEWDHPAIRFNLAASLFRLKRNVESYEHLIESMKYGPEPLVGAWKQAVEYKERLEDLVAEVVVRCDEPGAVVTLDGKYLFTGPGQVSVWRLVGEHQVVAQRPDRQTVSESLQVVARQQNRIEIERWWDPPRRVLVSRWEPWKPWAITGVGATAILVGVPLQILARSNMDRFDQAVSLACPAGETCTEDDLSAAMSVRARAQFQNRAAITSFVAGGAILAVGLSLVILNRPHSKEVPRLVFSTGMSERRALVSGRWSF